MSTTLRSQQLLLSLSHVLIDKTVEKLVVRRNSDGDSFSEVLEPQSSRPIDLQPFESLNDDHVEMSNDCPVLFQDEGTPLSAVAGSTTKSLMKDLETVCNRHKMSRCLKSRQD